MTEEMRAGKRKRAKHEIQLMRDKCSLKGGK
jgi:hypothetical protein